jgi:hypothetical protein
VLDGDWFYNGKLFEFPRPYPDSDLTAVTDYARSRCVRLVGHHETSADVGNYERQTPAALALYESMGVRQVRTGYVADAGDVRHIDAFDGYDPKHRVQRRLAKELSLYVVLYSPVQTAADMPANYAMDPDALQIIKDVPIDWDESVGLAGELGDFVAVARKQRGKPDRFRGALTDENPRQVSLKLDFLGPKACYVAEIYRDGPQADWQTRPDEFVIEKRPVTAADPLDLALAGSGGATIRLRLAR